MNTVIGTEATYAKDPEHPEARFTAEAVTDEINRQGGMGKMQTRGQKGTAIYNYPRSSPEMEAIYGVKVYAPKQAPNRVSELEKKLEAEMMEKAALSAKIDVILMQMAAMGSGVTQVEAKSDEGVSEQSYAELRQTAKDKGINTKGMSREKIEAAIREIDG